MLVHNLGSSDIPSHEILSDPTQLRSLAQLHESLDWFAKAVLKFARGLPTSASPGTAALSVVPPLPETTLNTLIALAKEFEEDASMNPPPATRKPAEKDANFIGYTYKNVEVVGLNSKCTGQTILDVIIKWREVTKHIG